MKGYLGMIEDDLIPRGKCLNLLDNDGLYKELYEEVYYKHIQLKQKLKIYVRKWQEAYVQSQRNKQDKTSDIAPLLKAVMGLESMALELLEDSPGEYGHSYLSSLSRHGFECFLEFNAHWISDEIWKAGDKQIKFYNNALIYGCLIRVLELLIIEKTGCLGQGVFTEICTSVAEWNEGVVKSRVSERYKQYYKSFMRNNKLTNSYNQTITFYLEVIEMGLQGRSIAEFKPQHQYPEIKDAMSILYKKIGK